MKRRAAARIAFPILVIFCRAALAGDDKIRVLVVTGGHDYDVPAFERLFAADSGVVVEHQAHPRALETLTSEGATRFDAVVLYDMYQPIDEAQKARYAGAIRRGLGVVALHHTLASFQAWPEYERIIGGKFLLAKRVEGGREELPSTYRHGVDISVTVADREHFITRGLQDFVIHDETYNRFRVDPAAHVLLRANHADSGPVIGWSLPYGKARVVYLQLGHDDSAYSNHNYRTLVSRAVRWAARRTPEDERAASLFNGKDLSGWRAEGKARFAVEDGEIVCRQGPGGEAGDLLTAEEHGDFELETTWRMEWPGNSGVWFRYQGPERAYQADILEWKSPVCWSGTLYCSGKMFLATNDDFTLVRRDGWNTFVVRAVKDHVTVHLNGRKVADVRDGSSPRGRIGFQVHAGQEFAAMALRVASATLRRIEE